MLLRNSFVAIVLAFAFFAAHTSTAQNIMQDGVNAYQAKEFDKAIELFTQSITQFPQFANQMYYNRGLSYNAKGDLANAKADFEKACQMGYQLGCAQAQALGGTATVSNQQLSVLRFDGVYEEIAGVEILKFYQADSVVVGVNLLASPEKISDWFNKAYSRRGKFLGESGKVKFSLSDTSSKGIIY